MSKQETVEVTVKVPKRLMDLLEAENYIGWKPEDFFEAAISSMIGLTVNNMTYQDSKEFHQKHGEDVGVFYLRSTRVVDC